MICMVDGCQRNMTYVRAIECLKVTSPAVKQPKRPPIYSVSFIRVYGKKVVMSTVILETQAARNLRSTTVSTVAVAQLPCRLDQAATRPGVQVIESVVSVQLPLNSTFFCHTEVLSHVVL